MEAKDTLAAQREAIQVEIEHVSDHLPEEARAFLHNADAIVDSILNSKTSKLGQLIAARDRIDEKFQISEREAAEKSAHETERQIKRTAEEVLAVNEMILGDLNEAQDHLRAFIDAIVRARRRFPVAQAGVNKLAMPSSFSLDSFNRRLSRWIADELCRAWPVGGDRLGEYISFKDPPYFQREVPHKIPRWRDREMDAARTADIEHLAALVEERGHI